MPERLEARVLLSISIGGLAWQDSDADGLRDPDEGPIAAQEVYLDQNRNRVRDAGEQATLTDAAGRYTFEGLPAGRYFVGASVPVGSEQTSPGPSGATVTAAGVSMRAGSTSLGLGRPTGQILTEDSPLPAFPAVISPAPGQNSPPVAPATVESRPLIGLDQFELDPRFTTYDGRGMSVAVLDTGIDPDHPFFGPDADGNGVSDRILFQYDFADNDADATDHHNHGTNVASIVGSQDTVYRGVAPAAGLIPLKVFSDGGVGDFGDVERALQWVVANAAAYNIAAVNMSLSDSMNHSAPGGMYGLADELASLASMGVIVVSAAGNEYYEFQAEGVGYPAADPNSLAVGAVYDADVGRTIWMNGAEDVTSGPDRVVSFSQRSTTQTDVFAPGVFITGGSRNGGTITLGGTSQAAPHVAGMAAVSQQMALQQLGRRLTVAEFRSMLRGTGVTINDGDDENDNVKNTGANFPRLDGFRFADGIYAGGTALPFGYRVDLADGQATTAADFGIRPLPIVPGRPALDASDDSGVSASDGITWRNSNLSFRVPGTFAGSTVLLYAGGEPVGSATGTKGQTTIVTNYLVDLPDGAHAITARQSVPGRPQSANSPAFALMVDTVAPDRPTLFDLLPSSDSGRSDSDNITNDSTPTFVVGGVPAGAYYLVLGPGGEVGDGYRVGSTFTSTLVGDGTHIFTLHARDAAGNLSEGLRTEVTVDTAAWNPDEVFDGTFGGGGISHLPANGETLSDLAAQGDGKLVAAGWRTLNAEGDTQAVIARVNPDGTPDPTFGAGGWVEIAPGDRQEFHAVEIQPDGKILAGGYTSWQGADGWYVFRFLLARLNTDGTLDTSFGTNGLVTSEGLGTGGQIRDLVVVPGGKIVVGGTGTGAPVAGKSTVDFFLARYTPTGQLDTTFGTGGRTAIDFTGEREDANAMAAVPGGKFVLTGSGYDPASGGWQVITARYDADGRLDNGFGEGGRVITNTGAQEEHGHDVDVAPDGGIVVAGRVWPGAPGTDDVLVLRMRPDGSPDPTFDDDGMLTQDFGGAFDRLDDVFFQPDGRIVAVGQTGNRPPSHLLVARWNADGSPDTSFGGTGAVLSLAPDGGFDGHAGLVRPDGKIVSGGQRWWTSSRPAGFALVRLNPGSHTPVPILDAASDTGASKADGITADDTPTFQFTGPAGSYFRLFRDGTLVSGAYHAGTTITLPAQPQGSYGFTAMAVDVAGNYTGQSLPRAVTIDTGVPTAAIVSVSPDPRIESVSAVTIAFSEPVLGVDLNDLRLTRNGGPNLLTTAQTVTTADGKTFTVSGLSGITGTAGDYVLTLTATGSGIADQAGNALLANASDAWRNNGVSTTVSLRAAADGYVRDGTYAGQSFGQAADLQVKKVSAPGYSRESYVRYDLSQVGSAAEITSAKVRLFGRLLSTAASSMTVGLYPVASATWSESGLTWNSRPAAGATVLGTTTVTGTTGKWYEFDVTGYLKQQKAAGAAAVAFALKATAAGEGWAGFSSDEAAANQPQMAVTQQTPTGGTVTGLTLINAATDTVIGAFTSGAKLELSGGRQYNVRAETSGTIGSIVFAVDGAHAKTESFPPYTVGGDAGTDYFPWSLSPGGHTLVATPYSDADGTGTPGQPVTVSFTVTDSGTTVPVVLRPPADGYVRDGSYASQSFGQAAVLEVKKVSVPGYSRESYVRFELSGVGAATDITSAKVRLFGRMLNTASPSVTVGLYPVANVSWGEAGLTWNTRPAAGATPAATATVSGTTGRWYEFDVTAYLRQQKAAGAAAVAFALKAPAMSEGWAGFSSDEAAADKPQLVVSQQSVPTPQGLVVSASELSVPEGSSASFTVKLAAAPAADVVVSVTKQPQSDPDVNAGVETLTFTPVNWNSPQTVTVTAAQDADTDNGFASFDISSEGLAFKSVAVTEQDDDAAAPVTVRAGADAYVRDGTYAGQNFGSALQLEAKKVTAPGYSRESYLRFDLAQVPSASAIASAKLRLFGRLLNTAAPSAQVGLYPVTSTSWSESGLTWNNRPAAAATPPATATVTGTSGRWYEFDLTSYLKQQKAAGATAVAFALRATAVSEGWAGFTSDEAALNRPEIAVN